MRTTIFSDTAWEKKAGYCRATKVDNAIWVSGTVAVDEAGKVIGENDIYQQTRFILHKIGLALNELKADYTAIVRTRIYITNVELLQEMMQAHYEIFHAINPASTCVVVAGLVLPALLIEIEADAVITISF